MSLFRRVIAALTAALATALVLTSAAATAATGPRGGELDGFVIGHLPEQADDQTSVADFSYEWEGVRFESRVWEKRLDGGGARVVLQVLVMRGDELTDLPAVRAFLAKYHERPLSDWQLSGFDNNGTPGLSGATEAFWSPAPQVAVEVRDPFGLLGPEELQATALGIGPSPG